MPVSYLSGDMRGFNDEPMMHLRDIAYFGIRSYEPEEKELIKAHDVLVINPENCVVENFDNIVKQVDNYFFPDGKK